VRLQAGTVAFTAITEDLSGGGISVHSAPGTMLRTGQPVTVRLMLPGTEPLNVHGIICRVSGGQVGVQFERDPEQERLRRWVEEFLE
jgi:hypothetical protein